MNILFVCTGNTCRSPMAEGICNKFYSDKARALSAGISVCCPMPASENAYLAAKELYDIDLSEHLSQGITRELLEDADRVYCVSKRHSDILKAALPEFSDKIFHFECEIADPYMQELEVYKAACKQIKAEIDKIFG